MNLRRHGKHEILIWYDDMRREAFRIMDEGLTAKEVGDKFGINPQSVHAILKRRGIARRPQGMRSRHVAIRQASFQKTLDTLTERVAVLERLLAARRTA